MANYRLLWEKQNGPIPTDESGRKYELHHINGQHADNRIENLKLVTIEEHFSIHERQGDWAACALMAKRMSLPSTYSSDIQRGSKRPGIGGAPKGRIPWNKGLTGYKMNVNRKGKQHSSKLTEHQVNDIRNKASQQFLYKEYSAELERRLRAGIGAPKLTYEWFLAKELHVSEYVTLTTLCLYKVITGKTWNNVKIKHTI